MSDYLGPLTFDQTGTYRPTRLTIAGSEAQVEMIVQAASASALAAAIEALVAQLRVGNTFVHAKPGITSPVVYTVAGVSGLFKLGDKAHRWLAFYERVAFTMQLTAAPAGALTTLYNAQAVNAPASLALDALLGTNPPQIDLAIDDASGNDMHCIIAALAPTAVTDAMWLILASSLTWTTMSSGTGADCWGNTSRYTTSASWQTATIDTSRYPAGRYRLYVRAKQSAGTGDVKESQNDTSVSITRTSQHLTVVSDVSLPVRDSAPGTPADLTVSVRSDGTNTFTVNAFLLIPLSWGSFSWHHETPTGEIDRIDVGPSGSFVWATGSSDGLCDTTYQKGGVLVPRRLACHVGTMLTTSEPSGNTWPDDWYRTSATYLTADTDRFKFTGSVSASTSLVTGYNGAAMPTRILVVPGEWYELSYTRSVTALTSGTLTTYATWYDYDGNLVRQDALAVVSTTDASPVAVTHYVKAPPHAVRIAPGVSAGNPHNLTAYYYGFVVRRCPLRLIVVAEDAAGTLNGSYVHPVAVTLRYTPLYEVSR